VATVGRVLSWSERLAWAGGLALLTIWAGFTIAGTMGARRELQRFAALPSETPAPGALSVATPDQSLWSDKRVQAWRDTLTQPAAAPLAVLRIPRIGVEVAVLEGTDEWTLNRAVGHIEATATPGNVEDGGNIGIAGHRDGFFRALKDVQAGDRLELQSPEALRVYRIARTWIVDPGDVSVLDPTPVASVTLVTCYPFYFVGPAPQRFIVRGELVGHTP
jgi:sortase A